MNKEIHSKSKTAFFWDLSGAFIRQSSSFVISTLLARLLGPKEFGVIALSMIVINISSVFTDIGFSSALIQQKSVKDVAYSSVFYINLGLAAILSIGIFFGAPWIAIFFEEPKLATISRILAIIPVISALGSIHTTMLTKNIDFKSLTIRGVFATAIAGVVAVIAAFSGLGLYSLVIQQILVVSVGTILVWYATKWTPKLEFSVFEIKKLFKYSSYIFLDNIIRRIFLNIDSAFVGKVFSPVALGLYNRAQSLKSQVDTISSQSLNKVIFPVFSKIQNDDKNFRQTYFKAFNTISGIMVLLVAPLYFLGEFLIVNLLGEQWERSVPLFQILVLSSIVMPQVGIMGKALLAKGFSKYRFKIGLLQRLMMLIPISVGYHYGMNYFALTLVITYYFVFLLFLLAVDRKLNIDFWQQFKNVCIPNILFFSYLGVDYVIDINYNPWLLALVFMSMQVLYLKVINHPSVTFLYHNISQLIKRFT